MWTKPYSGVGSVVAKTVSVHAYKYVIYRLTEKKLPCELVISKPTVKLCVGANMFSFRTKFY